jgi:dCTP deaminase
MILSDQDLLKRITIGALAVDPLDDLDVQIQPASIDLRLGDTFVSYRLPHIPCIDPRAPRTIEQYTESVTIAPDEAFILQPGEFALGTTQEWVRIPADLVARVEGRGRLAVVVPATAGFIDPGFEGRITLELSNLGRVAVKLYPGMRISQIVLHQLTSPAVRPYGPARGSKYWGQTGPVASRITKESRSAAADAS